MATNVKIVLSAQDKTAAAFKTAANNIKGLKSGALGLAASLGGLGAGLSLAGLASFTKSAIDSIDALNDISDATGASIENISALEDVAARTGTSMDTVTNALIRLNQTLNSAKADSPQAQALEAIGLSADELKKLDPAEALLKIATALAGFADDGNKARLSQELFGKSLKEVAPLLKNLADKGQLVATVTKEEAAQAEAFNKSLVSLQKSSQDLARDLAGPMVKSLNDVIAKFQEGEKAGKGFLETGLENYIANVRKFYGLKPPSVNIGGATGDFGPGAGGGRGSVNPELAKPSVGELPEKPTKTKTGGGAKDPYAESKRYLDNLQKQLERTQDLTAVQQLGFDLNDGRVGKITTAQQQELVNIALKIDTIKAQTEADKELQKQQEERGKAEEAFFADIMRMSDAKQKQIDALLGATPTAELAAQREDVQLLTQEFEQGRISEQLYLEAVSARLDLTADKTDKVKSLADELNLSFTSAFEDAIVGGKGLSEVLKGLEQDIMRIVTRKLVTEPLGNAISGAVSGFNPGDFISGLFSADGGGYTGMGARSGGLDGKGGFMAVLHPQETVVDHTRGQRLGSSVSITINQTFAPGTTRATTLQAAADASRQLQYAGRNL